VGTEQYTPLDNCSFLFTAKKGGRYFSAEGIINTNLKSVMDQAQLLEKIKLLL
jgi:hypothetical protein